MLILIQVHVHVWLACVLLQSVSIVVGRGGLVLILVFLGVRLVMLHASLPGVVTVHGWELPVLISLMPVRMMIR